MCLDNPDCVYFSVFLILFCFLFLFRKKRAYDEVRKYLISRACLDIFESSRNLGSISSIANHCRNFSNLQLAKLGSDLVVMKNINNTNAISSTITKEELLKMSSIKHDNLNPFLGICLDSDIPCILMMYASRGSLYDIIQTETTKLSADVKQSLILDIALGMRYLHNSSIGNKFYDSLQIKNVQVVLIFVVYLTVIC